MNIVVLTDYRGCFWSAQSNALTRPSMDVTRICQLLRDGGHDAREMPLSEASAIQDWSDVVVLYTSSEDSGLEYKSYIEDVMLALSLSGARLVPEYPLLRAHHNKAFMELLRMRQLPDDPFAKDVRVVGTYEDFRKFGASLPMPCIVKPSAGAGSKGVKAVWNAMELDRTVKTGSRSFHGTTGLREIAKRLLRPGYSRASLHRSKLVIQPFVPGLSGDFNVLVYGDRYYLLRRGTRRKSPTASGSGEWDFHVEDFTDVPMLLDAAAHVTDRLGSPTMSLDFAVLGGRCYLLEFQALHFGSATLERSERYFRRKSSGDFAEVAGTSILEDVFAEAIARHLSITTW